MSTIMQDLLLLQEIEDIEIDGGYVPQDEVDEGEIVIGEMNDSEKKLYIFRRKLFEELETLWGKSMKEGRERKTAQLSRMIDHMFWVCLEHRFNLLEGYEGDGIGVRKGWKVVIRHTPEKEDTEQAFERILALFSF